MTKRKSVNSITVHTHIETIHRERGKEQAITAKRYGWQWRNRAEGRPPELGRPLQPVVPGVPYTGPREKAPRFNRQALSTSEKVLTDLATARGLSLDQVLDDPELLLSTAAVLPTFATRPRAVGGYTAPRKEEEEEEEERAIKRARVTTRQLPLGGTPPGTGGNRAVRQELVAGASAAVAAEIIEYFGCQQALVSALDADLVSTQWYDISKEFRQLLGELRSYPLA